MKTRVMKKKFRRMLCASMAAIFVMSDMIPVASAQGTAAETLPAPTDIERIVGFEMVNPLNSYEIKTGESLESLDTPEKIRVIVELPEDTKLSTFEEGEAPEQTDDTLPAYEYSHTLEQLSMSSEEDTASSGEEAAPSGEDTASSEDSSGAATSEDPSSAQEPSYTEEEIAGLYQESLTKKLGTVNVYALTDNAGASQYRVYGSIEAQAPQWYAIDENGVMLGAVEELDANWDFTGFDSTVAGEHQVKAQLPENYILSEGVEMACLQIVVTQEEEEQSSIENEDGSLPDSLPVSYIQARAAQARAVAPFDVTIQREGIAQTIQAVFKGGTISADSKDMPSVQDYSQLKGYRLKETKGSNGKVVTNGASLMVTDASGATVAYSNVTAMYPLEQNGATVWYYTTTATSSSIAWKIPDNATLRFIYEPENPNDTTRFTKVTVTSYNWRDGSASGIFEDGKRDYVAVLPVGEEASITVDLPDLFSKISNVEYINFGNNPKPSRTTTTVQASTKFGPYKGNIDTTATFKFTVPEVANKPDGVTIRLTFSSYNNGDNSILWFRMSQPYLQKSHNYLAQDGNWSGYRAFRLFSALGTGQFTYNTPNSMYFQVGGGGSFQQVNQQGFQSYGPGIAPSAPSGYQHPNFNQDAAGGGTYDPVVKAQPGYHADDNGGTFNEVNRFWDTSTGALANSKSIPGDGNGDRTLFFTVENTLANLTPDFANNPNQVGQNLPVGFIVRTQRNPDGFFLPLETEADLGSGKKAGTVTNNEVLLTTSFSGMNIKVTRNWYNITSYKTNAGFPANGNLRDWKYSIQIQGAVGFLGINFVFPNDIQNYTNLQDVSPNVGSAQIFTTTGGNSTTGRQWITVRSGAGKNFTNYQFGATQYGKLGETEKTTSNGFFGTDANTNNWTINYVVTDAGNAGVPIRLERKEGYGIPYLVFPGYNNARAGISKLNVNAQGYSNIENFTIGATNRPVQGRMYRDRSGRVYFDYLFGHYRANSSWDGWGKNVVFRIQADPAYVAVNYSTGGVDLGSSPPAAFSKTAVYNDSATEYVVVPATIPQKPNSGTFIGWKIKKQGGGYVQQNGKDVFLQPGSVISVRDTQYFPKEQLPRADGVKFTDQDTQVGGTGYYNVTRITLEPAFANDTTTAGSLINGSITTELQNGSTSYNALKPDPVSVPEEQFYYIPHGETYRDDGGILYLYNAAKSKDSGQATTGTTSFGKLVYDKAFKVTYSNPTTGVPAGATPPSDNARYTMTDGNKNTINLQKPSGLTNAADFTGWKILYGNGQESAVIPSNVTQLVLNGAAQQNLQIDGTKATVGGTLAQSLFNEQAEASGTDKGVTPIRLQAVYSTLKRVESARWHDTGNEWNDQYRHSDNDPTLYRNQDLVLEGQFKYDISTKADIERYWETASNGGVRTSGPTGQNRTDMERVFSFALYGQSGGGNGTAGNISDWKTWNLMGDDKQNTGGMKTQLTLADDDDADGYGIATIRITIPASYVQSLGAGNNISTSFYLFAWNDASNKDANNATWQAVDARNPNSPFYRNPNNADNYGLIEPGRPAAGYSTTGKAIAHEYWFFRDNTMKPRSVESALWNTNPGDPNVWNDQYKEPNQPTNYTVTKDANTGKRYLELHAKFKYDKNSYSTLNQLITAHNANPTAAINFNIDDLQLGLYGIRTDLGVNDSGKYHTWMINGGQLNNNGVSTEIDLNGGTDDDNDGLADMDITIKIPQEQISDANGFGGEYNFYLFAWNSASNQAQPSPSKNSNNNPASNYKQQTDYKTDNQAAEGCGTNSPFSMIDLANPKNNYGQNTALTKAVANNYWRYTNRLPNEITNENGSTAAQTGETKQFVNNEKTGRTISATFAYDDLVAWSDQSNSANTVTRDKLMIALYRRDNYLNQNNQTENTGSGTDKNDATWKKVAAWHDDNSYGNDVVGGGSNKHTFNVTDNRNGTFTVTVTIDHSTADLWRIYDSSYRIVALNKQNYSGTLGSLFGNGSGNGTVGAALNNAIGTAIPYKDVTMDIHPAGVTFSDGQLSKTVSINKEYWQPSRENTVTFTYDNSALGGITEVQNRFSATGSNYHIGLYKKEGNNWTLVESDDTQANQRKYLTIGTPANGQIQVTYKFPAEENTANAQYRLMAFYGDVNGNHTLETNTLQGSMTDSQMTAAAGKLANVLITLNSSTFQKVVSNSGKNAWNAKHSPLGHMYNSNATNEGDNFVLTATFKYDINSRDIIQQYWDNKTPDNPTTDDGMGRYLNWAMYGYNPRTGESSTWVIREKNVTGEAGSGINQKINFTVDLSLGDQADASGYAVATIKIIIPKDEFNYENMSQQALYLFAWNDATNQTVDGYKGKATNYKALMHSDTSGGESPYTYLQSTGILSASGFGNNIGGDGPGMAARGPIASTYWYFNILPRAITQTDDTKADQTQSAEIINGDTNSHTISATFKYDNSIPWQDRQGVDNDNTLAGEQYDIRVGLYKKDYNGTWKPMAVWHGNGGFNAQGGNNYSLDITPNEQAGTFTVTATINSSVLGASYENYGAEYKIIAYNYANYSAGNIGTLLSNGTLNAAIGTDIPSNTTTVKMNPASMKSIDESGTATGTIDGVEFTTPKTAGEKTNIAFHFQGDGSSWLNGAGQSNAEMKQLFSTGGGNIIVSLWKRESNTDNFTFVDSFNKGTTSNPPASGTEDTSDYIKSVNLSKDTLNVEVQAGTDSNTDGTEYRVYAWYVTSNGNKVYDTSKITDASIFGKDTPVVSGTIPYATATVDMKNQAPDYYVTLPSNIILVDSDGNVKEAGTDNDISSQYAGAKAQVSYNTTNTGNIPPEQIPELTVEIENNVKMTSTAGTATDTHTVGVYFTDGYQNVTDGTQSGYVKLGTLSTIKNEFGNSNKGQPGQTMPAGTTLPFYLNTKQGNDEEIYTASVTFWFDIMNTTP